MENNQNTGRDIKYEKNYDNFNNIIYNSNNSTTNNNMYESDMDLIDIYIGEESYKIRREHFSLKAFFFGEIYFFIKGLYKHGIIYLGIDAFLDIIKILLHYLVDSQTIIYISNSLISFTSLCVELIMSSCFCSWYIRDVRKRVNEIEEKNPTATREELRKLCIKERNKNRWIEIICIFAIIVLYAISIFNRYFYQYFG